MSNNIIENTILMDEEKLPAKSIKQDFKMVTFSLGGKDYGIDIMKVKEIAKFSQFTYVPNTPPFVRGGVQPAGGKSSLSLTCGFFSIFR